MKHLRLATICLAALLFAGAARASDVVVVNNAALKAGQSMQIREYIQTGDGKEKLLKTFAVGPVEADCGNGCGMDPKSFAASGPGVYRLEVMDNTAPDDIASVRFTMKPGEEFVWMVSNRASPVSYGATAPRLQVIADRGPFSLHLLAYTAGPPKAAPAADNTASRRRNTRGDSFWPFTPVQKRSAPND